MKKFLSVLLVGVLGVLLCMPVAMAETKVKFDCKKDCELTSDDTCVTTCTFGITGNTQAITQWKANITLEPADKVQMGTVTLNDEWTNVGTGTSLALLSADTAGVSDADITFGTFTVTMPRDLDGASCKISLQPEGLEVVEETITTETQPSTGVTLPLIVLGCGLALAGVAYYVTRKTTKMYKI